MTRINTNISALTAQQNLANSNNMLQTTLTRLSTGLRINSAADDPAGMIAATEFGQQYRGQPAGDFQQPGCQPDDLHGGQRLEPDQLAVDHDQRPGHPGGQHLVGEQQPDRRQPIADRLVAQRHQQHRPDHELPGPEPVERQPGLQRRQLDGHADQREQSSGQSGEPERRRLDGRYQCHCGCHPGPTQYHDQHQPGAGNDGAYWFQRRRVAELDCPFDRQ